MKKTAFLAVAVLLIGTWNCRTAFGQPPPLGPPTYKSDTTDLSVSVITNFVRTTVQNAVNNANTQILRPSLRTNLSTDRLFIHSLKGDPAAGFNNRDEVRPSSF